MVHSLFEDAHDLVGLREAALLARTVMEAPPMASHVEVEQRPGPEVRSDEDWDDFLRANSFMAKHPVGTCAMGAGADAVLDPQLRVRGVDGLRVIDASVMPELPSGNTNAATVMIAERGADLVLGPSPVGA